MNLTPRDDDDEPVHGFINPYPELNAGLWCLFLGATAFLALRLWVKITRRHGMWYDDYILIVSWGVLLATDSLIVYQFGNGYVLENSKQQWDDRMHILINISSCGNLIGQAWTKTAFGVTLLRMSNRWQQGILWFCIFSMNIWMILKVIFQWAKVCDKDSYQNWYRLDFCIGWKFRDDFKEGGNVYNIIMDFVFASFPWLITRSLEMRRAEKVGLCLTMSLGMIVAIVAAIRVGWKDQGNDRDSHYMWRNGMSQIWYSSEVAGTIIVQCIPILRPILRDIHTSLTSRRLDSTADGGKSTGWTQSRSTKHMSTPLPLAEERAAGNPERVELRDIPEEQESTGGFQFWDKNPAPEITPVANVMSPTSPQSDNWPLGRGSESVRSMEYGHERRSHSSIGLAVDQEQQGLSPPPRRK
ncbi:hypothetical protein CEP54_003687 [Fusarium duplospermum]|uniref:Rhodopsin domain-containing protein n=1 Tax=Fusarium duplospermum TaxID=1325734 RepID=A0A428QMI1_9HYPO|nr:hypothetical protein CEP54_003687 [Fusarium duplospermum]